MKVESLLIKICLVFYLNFGEIFGIENIEQKNILREDADIEDFPFMVSLKYLHQHFCGGTILNETHILTAANCFTDIKKSEKLTIVAGSASRFPQPGEAQFRVPKSGNNIIIQGDIAVVELDKSLEFNEKVQKVNIQYPERCCSKCTVVGWGEFIKKKEKRSAICEDGTEDFTMSGNYADRKFGISTTSHNLRSMMKLKKSNGIHEPGLVKATVDFLPMFDCVHFYLFNYPFKIFFTTFLNCVCAGSTTNVCVVESGGPLLCEGAQVGVASANVKCGEKGHPTIFAKVAAYENWLSSTSPSTHCNNFLTSLKLLANYFIMKLMYLVKDY